MSQELRGEVWTGDINVETVTMPIVLEARRSLASVGRERRALPGHAGSKVWGDMRIQQRRQEKSSQWSRKETKRK